MARRGFWNSFYQGWDAGDKMSERFRTLAQRRDIGEAAAADQEIDTQYSPEQIAALTDQAEQAGGQWSEADQAYRMPNGGLQAPTNTPTIENGAYQTGQGQMVRPTQQFRLGGRTQDKAFTPEELREFRANRMADVYEKYGDPEKANTLRSQADQLKLGKIQYENAERQANEAKNVQSLMKLMQAKDTMTDEEFMDKLVGITDPMNKDGITHGFKAVGDGTFEVTQMRNNRIVGSKIVSPQMAFKEALKYASPAMYQQITGEQMMDRDFKFKQDRAGVADAQFDKKFNQDENQFQQKMDFELASTNEANQLRRDQLDVTSQYYQGILAGKGQPRMMNEAQEYALEQQKRFDEQRDKVFEMIDSGEISEQEGNRRLNRLRMKFGGGAVSEKPPLSIKDQQAVMEEVVGEISTRPDFKKLDPESKRVLIEREFQNRLNFYSGDAEAAAPVDYGALGAQIEKETKQGATGLRGAAQPTAPQKPNWWSRQPVVAPVQAGEEAVIRGSGSGAIIPRGLQMR